MANKGDKTYAELFGFNEQTVALMATLTPQQKEMFVSHIIMSARNQGVFVQVLIDMLEQENAMPEYAEVIRAATAAMETGGENHHGSNTIH